MRAFARKPWRWRGRRRCRRRSRAITCISGSASAGPISRTRSAIPLKKIFYALRPAVALRWLRLNHDEAVPPMHFPTLVAASALPADVVAIIDDLLARKAVTRELGDGSLPQPIGALIDAEFAIAREHWARQPWHADPAMAAAANALFRRWVDSPPSS